MLKFIRSFIAVILCFVFLLAIGSTAGGYYLLDKIPKSLLSKSAHKAKVSEPELSLDDDPNTPMLPPLPIGPSQVELLDFYDHVSEILAAENTKPICEILCDKSSFNFREKDDESLQMIKEFFDHAQKRSFNDPGFRLALLKIRLLPELFPKPVRDLVLELENLSQMTESEKLLFVSRAELVIGQFVFDVKTHESEKQKQNRTLSEMIKLKKQCNRKNKEATVNSCVALATPADW